MNDLVSEYQQYQDATAEEENEADEEEAEAWFKYLILQKLLFTTLYYNIIKTQIEKLKVNRL